MAEPTQKRKYWLIGIALTTLSIALTIASLFVPWGANEIGANFLRILIVVSLIGPGFGLAAAFRVQPATTWRPDQRTYAYGLFSLAATTLTVIGTVPAVWGQGIPGYGEGPGHGGLVLLAACACVLACAVLFPAALIRRSAIVSRVLAGIIVVALGVSVVASAHSLPKARPLIAYSQTSAAPVGAIPTSISKISWVTPLNTEIGGQSDYVGAYGGRPLVDYTEIRDGLCTSGVRGLDPATGAEAWYYEQPNCREPYFSGGDQLIILTYPVTSRNPVANTVYLDPATGKQIHPAADVNNVTAWIGNYGLIAPESSKSVTIVRPQTGAKLATVSRPSCPGGSRPEIGIDSSQDGWSGREFSRQQDAVAIGTKIFLPYICDSAGAGLWIIDGATGETQDVKLPSTFKELVPNCPWILDADGEIIGSGQTETGFLSFGVNAATGSVTWTSTTLKADESTMWVAVPGHSTATPLGLLDPKTGVLTAYPGSGIPEPNVIGVAIGGNYVQLDGVPKAPQISVTSVDAATGTVTVQQLTVPQTIEPIGVPEPVNLLPGGAVTASNGALIIGLA